METGIHGEMSSLLRRRSDTDADSDSDVDLAFLKELPESRPG